MIILLLCVFLLSSPMLLWVLAPQNSQKILVVDKTVPHPNYREHSSLFWVFNFNKVIPPNNSSPWEDHRDYLGYYPDFLDDDGNAHFEDLTKDDLNNIDLLYLADSYGVYVLDLVEADEMITALDYSHLIFGGFDLNEVKAIEDFVNSGGALVAEFNTFAAPTTGKPRKRLEELLSVEWTGWAGRYFQELSDKDQVPVWARRNWFKHYGAKWDFEGPGWLLTHEDTRLFVLQEDIDVERPGLKLVDYKEDEELLDGVYEDVPFYYWFDVNTLLDGGEELVSYEFFLTDQGKKLFSQFGVPIKFPAIVRSSKSPLRLYFAGDFSDNNFERGPYRVLGIPWTKKLFRLNEHHRDQRAFFWEVYVPLIENVLEEQK